MPIFFRFMGQFGCTDGLRHNFIESAEQPIPKILICDDFGNKWRLIRDGIQKAHFFALRSFKWLVQGKDIVATERAGLAVHITFEPLLLRTYALFAVLLFLTEKVNVMVISMKFLFCAGDALMGGT